METDRQHPEPPSQPEVASMPAAAELSDDQLEQVAGGAYGRGNMVSTSGGIVGDSDLS